MTGSSTCIASWTSPSVHRPHRAQIVHQSIRQTGGRKEFCQGMARIFAKPRIERNQAFPDLRRLLRVVLGREQTRHEAEDVTVTEAQVGMARGGLPLSLEVSDEKQTKIDE